MSDIDSDEFLTCVEDICDYAIDIGDELFVNCTNSNNATRYIDQLCYAVEYALTTDCD